MRPDSPDRYDWRVPPSPGTATPGRPAASRPSPPGDRRPALDGLRAVAVLSVFAYHLGFGWMRGGFLGVDVFFVLSGYLITALLLDEHTTTERIALASFWARRARRLLPALLVVVVAVTLLVRALTPVTEWPVRQADLLWTILYGANWHQIASDQDYFAQLQGASPLRHMWSLAIEEQFYLVCPVILALLLRRRLGGLLLPVILLGTIASVLAMADAYIHAGQSRAYYGTDTRAHELLVGAFLAVLVRRSPRPGAHAAAAGPVAGAALAAVVLAFVLVRDTWAAYYLGGSLAFAIVVAGLLWGIEAAPFGIVGHALSLPLPRAIGRISYGLYLWHWPAILFTPPLLQQFLQDASTPILAAPPLVSAIEIAAASIASVVSYHAVEKPIRTGTLPFRLTNVRVGVAVPATAVAAIAVVATALSVPAEDVVLIRNASSQCDDSALICIRHRVSALAPVVALMGDSVAKSLDPALLQLAQEHDWTYVAAAHNRCSVIQHWIADTRTGGRLAGWDQCYAMVPRIQDAVEAQRPALVMVTDRWLLSDSLDDSGQLLRAGTGAHVADTERRLDATVDELTSQNARLVFLHFIPGGQPIQCADPNPPYQYRAQCAATTSSDTLTPKYNAMLDRVAARSPQRVAAIDLSDVVCPGGSCKPKLGGMWIRYDGLHFTDAAAQWLAPYIDQRLQRAGVRV